MKVETTGRGFEIIKFEDHNKQSCSLQQSSGIGDYEDAYDRPGSSFLWFGIDGQRMHLSREQVADLIQHLQAWSKSGSLELPADQAS